MRCLEPLKTAAVHTLHSSPAEVSFRSENCSRQSCCSHYYSLHFPHFKITRTRAEVCYCCWRINRWITAYIRSPNTNNNCDSEWARLTLVLHSKFSTLDMLTVLLHDSLEEDFLSSDDGSILLSHRPTPACCSLTLMSLIYSV